jgi:hypothetical protein
MSNLNLTNMKTKLLFAMLVLATFTITSCTTDDMESTNIENQTLAKEGDSEEPGDPIVPKGRD